MTLGHQDHELADLHGLPPYRCFQYKTPDRLRGEEARRLKVGESAMLVVPGIEVGMVNKRLSILQSLISLLLLPLHFQSLSLALPVGSSSALSPTTTNAGVTVPSRQQPAVLPHQGTQKNIEVQRPSMPRQQ